MNDFVWVLLEEEDCEGGIIHEIYATKELAYKELVNLANKNNQQVFNDCFKVGVTTYSIEEYEVRQK